MEPRRVFVVNAIAAADAVLKAHPELESEAVQPAPEPNPPVVRSKPPVSYEYRIRKMSVKQLKSEVKRIARHPQNTHDTIFATILGVMLDSHTRGISPFPR
jgi:hypothetical protein